MIARKLDPAEHGKTRRLWEQVFSEDTPEFLDYYYFIKTRGNQIYVVEEDGEIRSMIHLNPYEIRIEGKTFPSFYIIAVATQKEYRGRGYMGMLLRRCMQEMYRQKVPFTFLMPAAEAIYTPYDFRYIYNQTVGKMKKSKTPGSPAGAEQNSIQRQEEMGSCDAMLWDAERMADFFKENFEGKWQVYAERSSEYYRTMILEQQSERGGVRLLKTGGSIGRDICLCQRRGAGSPGTPLPSRVRRGDDPADPDASDSSGGNGSCLCFFPFMVRRIGSAPRNYGKDYLP